MCVFVIFVCDIVFMKCVHDVFVIFVSMMFVFVMCLWCVCPCVCDVCVFDLCVFLGLHDLESFELFRCRG